MAARLGSGVNGKDGCCELSVSLLPAQRHNRATCIAQSLRFLRNMGCHPNDIGVDSVERSAQFFELAH
ncbi:hypothetical protein [Rhodococcus sp. MS16]|uniref:hypothetical protein n=1 Tax=Rhodococcus sp. MS16 TaxID=2579941 RepID=UPI001F5B3A93|nr:hypothetical protein [Rhodococcus sp. MS16]